MHIRRHARANATLIIMHPDLYAHHLVDTLFARLHIAGEKFRLLVDLLNLAIEGLLRMQSSGEAAVRDATEAAPANQD